MIIMSTKKVFVELLTFLETNKSKKIIDVLDKIKDLTNSKKNNITIAYDNKKKAYAIFCYYHKQWELLSDVEYGKKASSKSGFNTMCKIGTNAWTKQQSVARAKKSGLLNDVASQKVDPKELLNKMDEIETNRTLISSINKPKGSLKMPILKK